MNRKTLALMLVGALAACVALLSARADAQAARAFRWTCVRLRLQGSQETVDVSAADRGTIPAIAPRRCSFVIDRPEAGAERLTLSCDKPGSDHVAVSLICSASTTPRNAATSLDVGDGATFESFVIACAK